MNLIENIKSAMSNVLANKMRTLLTMLGIIIGIAAVIAITSIGNGSQAEISEQFDGLGVGRMTVALRSNSPRNMVTSDALKLEDYELLKNNVEGIKYISPVYSGNYYSVKLLDPKETNSATIVGVLPEYQDIMMPTLLYGRYINDSDVTGGSKVAVITDTTAKKIFGTSDNSVLGKYIAVKTWKGTQKYTVIGMIENENAAVESQYENEYPENIIIPISAAFRLFGLKTLTNITLVAENPDDTDALGVSIVSELDKKHGTTEKYNATSTTAQLDALNQITGTVTLLISGVAAISLLVGGIGVMNIMMVTVTERTREIGIRKSIGAKNRDIMLQFVVEAIILTFMGGILGILCGWGLGVLIGNIMSIRSQVSVSSVIIAVAISSIIGVVFGVYPANKAANLDPIEALRYE